MKTQDLKTHSIGFVGQGWVGKNYADSFEDRGFSVTRYSLEEPHFHNKQAILSCDVVFIAVPTPTTVNGFDARNVNDAVKLVGEGKVAVIKSTVPPGTTRGIAEDHKDKFIFHSPEFLREAFAREDIDKPERLFVGTPRDQEDYMKWARVVLQLHIPARYSEIVSSEEAEFIKYTHNSMGYSLIVFMNILYDLAKKYGVDWSKVKDSILKNPWYPSKYLDPVHKGGRGAGGGCFVKDFAALRYIYESEIPEDAKSIALLRTFEEKNIQLLSESGKNADLIEGVYGKSK